MEKEMQMKLKNMPIKVKRRCYKYYTWKGNIDNANSFYNRFSNSFFYMKTGQPGILEAGIEQNTHKGERIMRAKLKKKSILKDLLKDYAKNHEYFTTIDVDNWKRSIQSTVGNIPGILSAGRYIRKMTDKRESDWYCLHRLSQEEKKNLGFNTKFGTYKYIK